MSRIVLRHIFEMSELQPYREVDLSTLLAGLSDVKDGENRDASEARQASPEPDLTEAELSISPERERDGILAEALRQADALKREAFGQGRVEAREAVKKELELPLAALAKAAQELALIKEECLSRFTPQIVELALQMAEKIVGKRVEEDPQIVASILERARDAVPQGKNVRIFLNPADYHALLDLRPDLVREHGATPANTEMIPFDEIERGGCRVESDAGIVDATITTQLEEMRRQILEEEAPESIRR